MVRSETTTSTILAVLIIAMTACEFDNSLRVLRSVTITLPVRDTRNFAKGKCSSQESYFQQASFCCAKSCSYGPTLVSGIPLIQALQLWTRVLLLIALEITRERLRSSRVIYKFDTWSCNVCQRDRNGAINLPLIRRVSCGRARNLRTMGFLFGPSGVYFRDDHFHRHEGGELIVIMPAPNEAENIAALIREVEQALTGHAYEPSSSAMVTLPTVRGSEQRRLRMRIRHTCSAAQKEPGWAGASSRVSMPRRARCVY